MKKVLSISIAVLLALTMAACGTAGTPTSSTATEAAPSTSTAPQSEAVAPAAADAVTIRVFSNLPDRTNGQGLVEQTIFDDYVSKNPNIKIEVETLDDEAYKTKFKAYASGTDMPDLVSVWGQPGFIAEVIEAGLLAELNEADYADYGFISGSMDGFRGADGKLYGLPRNTDVMGIYYNKALFDANGWSVPQNFNELVALCGKVRADGLEPIAMDGADKWPVGLFYHDLVMKYQGKNLVSLYGEALGKKDFHTNPVFLEMAKLYQQNAAAMFQVGFETQDYGTAMNLFTNGLAAMYYMGSWEMSMANNKDIPEDIRNNIHVFTMPVLEGGAGKDTDIAAWNGGGHSVTASGKQKGEAVKLLNYMYLPENWTRLAWENNVCMSAQDFAQYKTGNETPVQLEFIDVVQKSTTISGTPLNDSGTAESKTNGEDLSQELAASMITPEQYIAGLEK